MVRIDYLTEVYCSHCGEPHNIIECKFIVNWGYKCPECGRKCRTKAKSPPRPYIPSRTTRYMHKDIRESLGITKDRSKYMKRYNKEHPEVKQRFYEKHPDYNKIYMEKYKFGKKRKELV